MPQITVTIPPNDKEIIELIADRTGASFSSVAAQCINSGLYVELEKLNRSEEFKKIFRQIKEREQE